MRIFQFAQTNNPLPTQRLQVVRPDYKSKEDEILTKVLIKEEYVGEGAQKKKILYYQDQKRSKIINWNDEIHYTEPEMIREWEEVNIKLMKSKLEKKNSKQRNMVVVVMLLLDLRKKDKFMIISLTQLIIYNINVTSQLIQMEFLKLGNGLK